MEKILGKLRTFFSRPVFSDPRTLLGLWTLLALVSSLMKFSKCNNFLIFKYVYWHAVEGVSLYAPSPLYDDVNHYGPLFSLVVAPFAIAPHPWGLILWHVAMTLVLFYAVRRLPLAWGKQVVIYWFCAHELLTALFMSQFNIIIAAIIIGAFILVERGHDGLATLLIIVGTFVKLYGIAALAFFFFSRHKRRFVLTAIGWAAVMYVVPCLVFGFDYINGQYAEWITCLGEKNGENMFSLYQNQSLLGMVRKISGCASYSDLWLLVPGLVAFCLPYLRRSQYGYLSFRLAFLASALMFVVLFSTGSESSTYIIALLGVAVWYVSAPWKRSRADIGLMVFAFILTSMSPSDLFPAVVRRQLVQPYALKALPCIVVWAKLVYELLTRDYKPLTDSNNEDRI